MPCSFSEGAPAPMPNNARRIDTAEPNESAANDNATVHK